MHRYFASYVATDLAGGGQYFGDITWSQPTPLQPDQLPELRKLTQQSANQAISLPTITSIFKFED